MSSLQRPRCGLSSWRMGRRVRSCGCLGVGGASSCAPHRSDLLMLTLTPDHEGDGLVDLAPTAQILLLD